MMQNYEFYSTGSLEEALEYISVKKGSCKIIAGGTDLMPSLRREEIHPDCILNIMEVEGLRGIRETGDEIRIGSTTTFTEIIESDLLNRYLPLLVQAASSVGGPQIRNRGTLGGNIVSASPCADAVPAVLALNGRLEVSSKKTGTRSLPLAEAFESAYRSRLRPDEILTGLVIGKPPAGTRSGFEKLGRRNAMARARMSMSIVLALNGKGFVSQVRIVPGAVMPFARRMVAAENIILNRKPEQSDIDAAAAAVVKETTGVTGERWSTEYKMPVLQNIFRRVLEKLL